MKKTGKKRCQRWREYERRKKALQGKPLSASEYEEAIKRIAKDCRV